MVQPVHASLVMPAVHLGERGPCVQVIAGAALKQVVRTRVAQGRLAEESGAVCHVACRPANGGKWWAC